MAAIKGLPCGVCDAPAPSEAHHIQPKLHYITIPLCAECHRSDKDGIHGARMNWKFFKKTELSVLNDTIERWTNEDNS